MNVQEVLRVGSDLFYVAPAEALLAVVPPVLRSYGSVLVLAAKSRLEDWRAAAGEHPNILFATPDKVRTYPDRFPCTGLLVVEGFRKLRSLGKTFQCLMEKRLLSDTILFLSSDPVLRPADAIILNRLFFRSVDSVDDSIEALSFRVLVEPSDEATCPILRRLSDETLAYVENDRQARERRREEVRRQDEAYQEALVADSRQEEEPPPARPGLEELRRLRCQRFG
jgi:hypothetical protein